jgi:hypothetical protein
LKAEKPIALWAVPRSISTAFERVFVERGDFKVLHEPFSTSYYYSEERQHDRYVDEEPREEYNFDRVLASITAESEKPVFFKDMAYYVKPLMSPEFVSQFTNTFIIREPKYVLASLYKKWQDFTLEETGYEQLHRLYRTATEDCGQESVVVDAQDFSENPEAVIRAYCERLGIPFRSDALSWEKREVPEWEMWDGWHDRVQNSTGIRPQKPKEAVELPEHLAPVYDYCRPFYEKLSRERLRVS